MIPITYQKNTWVVTADTVVNIEDHALVIPAGFKTDLASIPRFFWVFFPPFGTYQDAAIIHDYLLDHTSLPIDRIHAIFYKKMKEDGVNLIIRFMFYAFVNAFYHYRK